MIHINLAKPMKEPPRYKYYALMRDFGRYMEEVETPHLKRMTKIWDDFAKKMEAKYNE